MRKKKESPLLGHELNITNGYTNDLNLLIILFVKIIHHYVFLL